MSAERGAQHSVRCSENMNLKRIKEVFREEMLSRVLKGVWESLRKTEQRKDTRGPSKGRRTERPRAWPFGLCDPGQDAFHLAIFPNSPAPDVCICQP